MIFVDGENLSLRFKAQADTCPHIGAHVESVPDVYVWSKYASRLSGPEEYIRRHYYTSCSGDEIQRSKIAEDLRKLGIEAPRVFHRDKNGRSKKVDISLATDMLTHAHRDNYDIAVLVSGDGDYVPLVEAVKYEGKRVVLWALSSGLSKELRASADHYWDIGELFFYGAPDQRFLALFD
jgi:uncharacterized LabA/DUF88 family protein